MAKGMRDVMPYLISGSCLLCIRYKGNEGQCEGKIISEGCLGFKENKRMEE